MRVKPIIRLGVLAGALALPGFLHALGLGRLTVQSALGQPLSAQIELTSAARDELDSLSVRIADPALYRQNNLAYNSVLSRAKITVERNAAGDAYLRIVTPAPVNEPYLDLMVEVNWAAGRLVREYTFLLDPPGAVASPVDPVAPARTGAAPARAPAAQPAARPAPSAAAGSGVTGAGTLQGGTPAAGDYPVQRGDTLSKIAAEYKPPSVSLEQTMVAMYTANQRAFDGNNMNRLRAGAIMSIPAPDAVAATEPAEANKVVRMQASDWRAYRDRVAATAPASDATGTRNTAGRIGAAAVDSVPAAPAGRDQLKVSRTPGAGKGGAGAAEDSIARDNQIREAQARIAELEKTVSDLQRAVTLKNQTLAQAQTQAEAGKAGKAAEPRPAPAAKPEPPPAPVPEPAKVAAATKAPEPAKLAEAPKATEPGKAAAAPKPEPAKAVEPPKEAAAPPVVAPKPVQKTPAAAPPKPEPSFIDDLTANTPTWALGGGALVILGGLAAIIAARRRKVTKYEDGILADTDIKTNTVFGSTGGGVVNTGDNSLSSEFSREGLGNIDTDEVDPIAEAEVYLAYGRDAQAEEILKHALRKDPQRQEVYLKLLEIHAQHNKPSAFESVAAELYAVSQGKGETWQKAVALGRQLDPSNPLFVAPEGSAAADAAAAASAVGDTENFSVMPDLKPEAAVEGPGAARGAKGSDFDLRLDEDLSAMPKADGHGRVAAGAAIGAAAAAVAADKLRAEPAATVAPAAADRAEIARVGADLDFYLEDSERPAPLGRSGTAEPLTRPQPPIDRDKLDLSFDHSQPAFEDATPSVLDGQWHDAATKLDLAKAYQEMGDVEGAREILQEVLREGDEQQKTEARALIAKLA